MIVGVDEDRVVGARSHARLTTDADRFVEIYNPVCTFEHGGGRTRGCARRMSALVAACYLVCASCLWKDSDIDVFDVGARDGERNEILRLARRSACVTADTACMVNYLGPLNRVGLFHHRCSAWERDYTTLTNPARRNTLVALSEVLMRLKLISFLMILAAAVLFVACNAIDHDAKTKPVQGPETVYADGARRVTIEEMEAMVKDGTAVVIDVRNQAAYDAGHIPGSKLIPAGEILNHINELPRDKTIVTYCS